MPVDTVSLAVLLDELRPLILAARARGENPRFVRLGTAEYDTVAACKAGDRERGMPMIALGLEIVRADDPHASPQVF